METELRRTVNEKDLGFGNGARFAGRGRCYICMYGARAGKG